MTETYQPENWVGLLPNPKDIDVPFGLPNLKLKWISYPAGDEWPVSHSGFEFHGR